MRRVGYALAVLVLAAAGAGSYILYLVFTPTETFSVARIVSIQRGISMTGAASKLATAGVVRSKLAFVIYAEWSGLARRLKPGDYAFKGGEAMPAVLNHLVSGDFMVVTVTIPEGMTIHQ